jgi:hypothetical protein
VATHHFETIGKFLLPWIFYVVFTGLSGCSQGDIHFNANEKKAQEKKVTKQ